MADAIRRMKYASRSDLAAPLAELLARKATPLVGRFDAVVPIPLHRRRRRRRGFDQAALLADPVARALGLPLRRRWLLRSRDTAAQAGLDGPERRRSLLGAFRATAATQGKRLLIVDDVRTTGATFAAASEALLEAGADEVRPLFLAATVARVDRLFDDPAKSMGIGLPAEDGEGAIDLLEEHDPSEPMRQRHRREREL